MSLDPSKKQFGALSQSVDRGRTRPQSGPASAKTAHEVDNESNHEDQPESAAAKDGTTKIKATAAKKQQKHNK